MKSLYQVEAGSTAKNESLYLLVEVPSAMKEMLIPPVKEVFPDITLDRHAAHITLLYLGDSYQESKLSEIQQACQEALKTLEEEYQGSKSIWMEKMGFFKASTASKNRTPILCKVRSDYLQQIHAVFLRAMMPYSEQKQFLWYKPHMTVGF